MSAHFDDDSSDRLPRWFGDYVLLKRLGHGGMGQVFLARSPGLHGIDRLCVIKTLRAQWTNDREYVARFVDEARVVVQLNHRNICPVFDVGQHHNTYYLAMDLVPGRDLQAVLQRTTQLGVSVGVDVALQIVAEVVDALDAAHRLTHLDDDTPLNLVHRDVSPHNVLVSFDGEVKLIDFGLAHSALKHEHTEPGVVLGKLAYMAPEHARGDVVDRRADLFAVGVILYELVVGDRFWAGLSVTEIWQHVGSGQHRPPQLARLDADVRALIERAIAANPADRFASGAEMRKAIVAAQIVRGVVADAADVRALMERLFAGEALADRKERGALQKLPAPPRHDVGGSTRIAASPSTPPASSRASASPPTGDEDPTFNDREPAAPTDTGTGTRTGVVVEPTQRAARRAPGASPSPTSPPMLEPAPHRSRLPIVVGAIACCLVFAAAFVIGRTPSTTPTTPTTPMPPSASPTASTTITTTPPAPASTPTAPMPVAALVTTPVVAPSEPIAPPTPSPVTTSPTTTSGAKPKHAPPKPTAAEAPSTSVKPAPLPPMPRFLDDKVTILDQRCRAVTTCAAAVVAANPGYGAMSTDAASAHKAAVDACYARCEAALAR